MEYKTTLKLVEIAADEECCSIRCEWLRVTTGECFLYRIEELSVAVPAECSVDTIYYRCKNCLKEFGG